MSTSNKPQIANTSEAVTDSIINSNQQDVKSAKPVGTTRAVNSYGISIMKGGNVLGTSFVEAVMDAYTNVISYQPIATILMLIAVFYYVSHMLDKADSSPFKLIHRNVISTNNSTKNSMVKAFSGMISIFTATTVDYQPFFAAACALGFPYFSKPSSRNAIISGILMLTVTLMDYKPVAILALSQLYFLMVQLRSPRHKTIVFLIAVICIFISQETVATLSRTK